MADGGHLDKLHVRIDVYQGGNKGVVGGGHSDYRANMALVAFNSLHVRSLGQSCSRTQVLFVLNLYKGEE